MSPFSPAQLVGYLAFALGVYSFLQKNDQRLKAAVALQAMSYALHFTLLGSLTAGTSSLITFCRAILSLYTRSRVVAAVLVAANIAVGLTFAHGAVAWLPVMASTIGTLAFFLLHGIAMRGVLLCATCLWLTNNMLVGSIGGTMLELFIGLANAWTILRLSREQASDSSA